MLVNDEVFAKMMLTSLPKIEIDFVANEDGVVGSDNVKKPVTFAKILTQSNANTGSGFSVLRYCAGTTSPSTSVFLILGSFEQLVPSPFFFDAHPKISRPSSKKYLATTTSPSQLPLSSLAKKMKHKVAIFGDVKVANYNGLVTPLVRTITPQTETKKYRAC